MDRADAWRAVAEQVAGEAATDRDLLQRAAEALRSAREYMLLYHQKCSVVCAEAATENYDKVLSAIESRLKETA